MAKTIRFTVELDVGNMPSDHNMIALLIRDALVQQANEDTLFSCTDPDTILDEIRVYGDSKRTKTYKHPF